MKPRSYGYDSHTLNGVFQPLSLANALVREWFAEESFVLYEMPEEICIAAGVLAELELDSTGVVHGHSIDGPLEFRVKNVVESLPGIISSLGIDRWRLYGLASFELSNSIFDIPLRDRGTPIQLLKIILPRIEVRISNNVLHLDVANEVDRESVDALIGFIEDFVMTGKDLCLRCEDLPFINDDLLQGGSKYKEMVAQVVGRIQRGDLLKAIISRRIELPYEANVVATFFNGRPQNSPARSFIVKTADREAAGFCPEIVVSLEKNGQVYTQPLAGTRAIGHNAEEESSLKKSLVEDNKELAEHAMSVRLAVSEMRSVCKADTVVIKDFMSLARRGSVQHLASRVEGEKAADKTAWEVFGALFPAITASGIGKREAIELIQELEPESRGLYSGAILRADASGVLDAALILRSVYQEGGHSWIQAGAGIVRESSPEREFLETCEKFESIYNHLVRY